MGFDNKQGEELMKAVKGVVHQRDDAHLDIEQLLTIVANGYGISKRTLKKARSIGKIREARNVAYCILHFELKLSCRYIALKVFCHKAHNNVWEAVNNYKSLNKKIKSDREFQEKYDQYNEQLIEFIRKRQQV